MFGGRLLGEKFLFTEGDYFSRNLSNNGSFDFTFGRDFECVCMFV